MFNKVYDVIAVMNVIAQQTAEITDRYQSVNDIVTRGDI